MCSPRLVMNVSPFLTNHRVACLMLAVAFVAPIRATIAVDGVGDGSLALSGLISPAVKITYESSNTAQLNDIIQDWL